MMNTSASNHSSSFDLPRLTRLLTCVIFFFWTLLLGAELGRRLLEYDELWTLFNYMELSPGAIFTELGTPNNHPLHSFCCKYVLSLFQDAPTASVMRLPAFCAGMLLGLVFILSFRKFPSPYAMPLGAAALLFTPILFSFASTARGYSMQSLFFFCFVLLLIRERDEKKPLLTALLLFLSAAATCLTVTSGLIFICAAGGAWLVMLLPLRDVRACFRERKHVFYAAACFLIFAGLWYGCNYSVIAQGRCFGTSLSAEPGLFFRNLGWIFLRTGLFLYLPLSCLLFCFPEWRKYALFNLLLIVFSFAASAVTNLGPDRVYVPLVPPLIAGAAAGVSLCLERIRVKSLAFLLFIALSVSIPASGMRLLPHFRAIEWTDAIEIILAAPEAEYPVFPPTESLRVSILFPDLCRKGEGDPLTSIVLYECGGILTVEDVPDGAQTQYDVSSLLFTTEYLGPTRIRRDVLPLKPLTEQDELTENTLLFAVCRNGRLASPDVSWKILNLPMCMKRGVLVFVKRGFGMTYADCREIADASHGETSFYIPLKKGECP